MSEQERELRFEGIVHASGYVPGVQGKQFVGATIESDDGREWVIDYNEQSPFHALAGRRVAVSGTPYVPDPGSQYLVRTSPDGKLRPRLHLHVSKMRLLEVTPDAVLEEVSAASLLSGQFERTSRAGKPNLSFSTEKGDSFLVLNNPAGAAVSQRVEACVYPVQPAASDPRSREECVWAICPCSAADLWEWRGRQT